MLDMFANSIPMLRPFDDDRWSFTSIGTPLEPRENHGTTTGDVLHWRFMVRTGAPSTPMP